MSSSDATQRRQSPYSKSRNTREQNEFLRSRVLKTSSKTYSSSSSESSREQIVTGKGSNVSSSISSIGSWVSDRSKTFSRFSSTLASHYSEENTRNQPRETRWRNLLFVQRDLISSASESVGSENVYGKTSTSLSSSSSKTSNRENDESRMEQGSEDSSRDSRLSSRTHNSSENDELEMEQESEDSQSVTENNFEEDGSVYRPDTERKFISGPKNYFRGDLNRVLRNSIMRQVEMETRIPQKRFFKVKEPKETEEALVQRQLEREEEERIDNEMEVEANEINFDKFSKFQGIGCQCDSAHPDYWSEQLTAEVHRNFYKIKHNDLEITEEMILIKDDQVMLIKLNMNKNCPWKEKALQVIEFIDIELGNTGISKRYLHDAQVYMMLKNELIIACTVANKAHQGFRLVSRPEEEPKFSPTPEPIKCGISRIWVLPKYRRNKLGSLMLESVKECFMAEFMEKEDMGYSDPSILGRLFLAYYMGRNDFKVYFPDNEYGNFMNADV